MERTTIQHDLSRMSQEHQLLAEVIADVRSWIREVCELGMPHFGELGDRLRPLHEQLARHFRHEEELGYLSDALARAPHLTGEANILLQQHGQLLRELNELILRLHETEPPFDSWQQACSELDAMLAELDRHEGREKAILEIAFAPDHDS